MSVVPSRFRPSEGRGYFWFRLGSTYFASGAVTNPELHVPARAKPAVNDPLIIVFSIRNHKMRGISRIGTPRYEREVIFRCRQAAQARLLNSPPDHFNGGH